MQNDFNFDFVLAFLASFCANMPTKEETKVGGEPGVLPCLRLHLLGHRSTSASTHGSATNGMRTYSNIINTHEAYFTWQEWAETEQAAVRAIGSWGLTRFRKNKSARRAFSSTFK